MPPTKRPYPPEFRREAVQLVQNTDRSIAQVALDPGVSNQTLRNWIKQADVNAIHATSVARGAVAYPMPTGGHLLAYGGSRQVVLAICPRCRISPFDSKAPSLS